MEAQETFRVEKEVDQELERQAKEWDVSKSWLLRYLVKEGLAAIRKPVNGELAVGELKPEWKTR